MKSKCINIYTRESAQLISMLQNMVSKRQRQEKTKKKKNTRKKRKGQDTTRQEKRKPEYICAQIKLADHYLLLGLSLRATAVASLRSFRSLASSAAIRTACSYMVVRRQQRIWCKRRNRYQLLLHMNNLYSSSWEKKCHILEHILQEYKSEDHVFTTDYTFTYIDLLLNYFHYLNSRTCV